MNRNFLWLAAIGLVSMLAGVLLFNQLQPDPQNKTSATAETPVALHSIPLFDLSGQQTTIGDWEANILIVNFWAPWCAP